MKQPKFGPLKFSATTGAFCVLFVTTLIVCAGLQEAGQQQKILVGGLLLSVSVLVLVGQITSREEKEKSAKAAVEADTWERVFENSAQAIMITDANSKVIRVNPAFGRITGYSATEVIGLETSFLHADRHALQFYELLRAQVAAAGFWQGGLWQKQRNGDEFFSFLSALSVKGREGKLARQVYIFNEAPEQAQHGDPTGEFAYHDILTGLPNRYLLHDRLTQAVETAHANNETLALMFIDLDRFKVVNDSLGYEFGDALLMETAKRIKHVLRQGDTLARLGGDEFVVLAPNIGNVANVSVLAEQVNAVMANPMHVKGHDFHIGASVGIALYPRDGESALALMKNADTAMYRSKADGSNGFRFFDQAMNESAVERIQLEQALRRALLKHEFMMHYQPKVNLITGEQAGAEALIRWLSPEHGQIAPAEFIPLAEETGLITKIGDWVLDEVCRQMADWIKRGVAPSQVAINVSARQFLDEHFADKVILLLERYKLEPKRIELELTEGTMMSNPELAVRQLVRLQEVGVVVSVDDFGTGYSSLTYLKRLPIGTIKVDQSFIRLVHDDGDNAAIVSAIQGMAEALGMKTVAEGIESQAEENHLRLAGCTYGQGFHYSKPLSASEYEQWVVSHRSSDQPVPPAV